MMKFSAPKDSVEKCVMIANSIISGKPSNILLTNILLETKDDTILVTATDLEVGIRTSFIANIEKPGSITINGNKFLGAVKNAAGDDIHFHLEDNNVVRINENSKSVFSLKGVPKENFPVIPEASSETQFFSLPQKMLKTMIKRTLFSISNETTRQYLNGVYFETENGLLRLVSTDGRRLALIERNIDIPAGVKLNHIIPSKILSELVRYLGEEGSVEVAFSDKQGFFRFEGIIFTTSLIMGNFPDYNQVIPKEQSKKTTIQHNAFLEALNRSGLFVEKSSNQVRMDFSENHLVVSIVNNDHGSLRDELGIEYQGDPIEIAFNHKYLMDYFKEVNSEQIRIEMNTPLSPVSIHTKDDEQYLYIVMPMKVEK